MLGRRQLKIKPAGHFSCAEGDVHIDGVGPDGATVLFAPPGRLGDVLYELLDEKFEVVRAVTAQDFYRDWVAQWPEDHPVPAG